MKISAKLLVLTAALFIVVGSIMFFFKAMTMPPTKPENIDEFSKAIIIDIDNINNMMTQDELQNMFLVILQEIKKWNSNRYISDTLYNVYMDKFYKKYIPTFVSVIERKFSGETWGLVEKRYVSNQIGKIRLEQYIGSNKKIVENNSALDKKIKELESICNNYVKAYSLLSSISYVNLEDAKKRINQAQESVNDMYISHSNLEPKLNSFAENLGNSHYRYVRKLYSEMENWTHNTLSQTEDTYSLFEKTINDYANATIYGSNHPKSLSDMKDNAKIYMKQAYDEKCYVTVNSNTGYYNTSAWSSDAGLCIYEVKTNHPDGYKVSDLSSWIRVTNMASDKFIITYDANNSSDFRKTYFYVNAGNKQVKVNVLQEAQFEEPTISIISISQSHNVYNSGRKGMSIIVHFNANGCQNTTLSVNLYFYFTNGNALKDYNGSYRTSDGQVATHQKVTPTSESYTSHVTIFMPYDELHLAKGHSYLKFYSAITLDGKSKATSSYYYFDLNKD